MQQHVENWEHDTRSRIEVWWGHVTAGASFVRRRPSTILGFFLWGATGFMAWPTLASFFVHFIIAPIGFIALIWLAHWEGKRDYRHAMHDIEARTRVYTNESGPHLADGTPV